MGIEGGGWSAGGSYGTFGPLASGYVGSDTPVPNIDYLGEDIWSQFYGSGGGGTGSGGGQGGVGDGGGGDFNDLYSLDFNDLYSLVMGGL